MSLTEQQQLAAYAPGSVAVLAGAGSGKTHMLVARYLKLLESYSPLEIPAVTFTEAGASELRARVRQAVIAQRPSDTETLAELEAAQISTIHALCGRIVRDHPAAAGVRPDAAVMDEQQNSLWLARNFREALAHLRPALFQHLPFSVLEGVLRVLLADPLLAEKALGVGQAHWEDWTAQAKDERLQELLRHPHWQAAVSDLRRFQGEGTDRMEQARTVALDCIGALERSEGVAEALSGLTQIKLTGGSAKQWPAGGLAPVKEALKVVRALAEEAAKEGLLTHSFGEADEWLRQALPDLREAFTEVREFLSERKRRAGILDFSDLEVHALQALRRPEVAAHYAERWKAFLIDEAQDTNPVQAEILELLSASTQRTLVGDLKQSIYGFRRAAPALFQATSDQIVAQGGQQITLDLSFRTHSGLLDVTNPLFAQLLGELYAPLQGVRSGPQHSTLEAWELNEIKPKALARQAEAALITTKLQAMLKGGYRVFDKAQGQERPLQPGDVAVLTRGWAALEPVRQALCAAGLPVQDLGTGSLLETQEAQDGLALLAAVALHDPVAIVTVLRSPLVAVPDSVIQDLAVRAQDGDWMQALLADDGVALASARRLFGELKRQSFMSSPSDLLLQADHLTGYTAVLANLWNAERRLADWQGFIELVRQLERGEDGPFSVVRELRTYLREDVSVPRPLLEGKDAITLSTMHSSKGLEWPVVVVADLNWSVPPGDPEVLVDAEMGVALRGPFDQAPALHTLLAAKKTAGEMAETKRLLYVALTRARDHLMLTASGPSKESSLFGLLTPALAAAGVSVAQLEAPELAGSLLDLPELPVPARPQAFWTEAVELLPAQVPLSTQPPSPHVAPPAPTTQGDWEELFENDLLDPAWLDWARQLAAEGIPAPHDVHRDLPSNGRVSGRSALMIWERQGHDVMLMEGEQAMSNAVLVSLNDRPAEIAGRLRPLLEQA